MDRKKEQSARVQILRTDKMQTVETVAEIVLPDYRSEISKLLWVHPTVLPPTRFIGGGKADFSGPVRYDILYVGPDGRLYGTEAEEGYAFSTPVEEGGEPMAEVVPDAVISRVTGPRKLSVRCRLRASVRSFNDLDLTPRVRGDEGARVERLCEAVSCRRTLPIPPAVLELSDAMQTDPGDAEWRLISARGAVFLSEALAAESGVRCRGEVLLSLLCCTEGGEEGAPQLITRRIPFEQEIPAQGITPACAVSITGQVSSVRTEIEEGQIVSDVALLLWGEGQAEDDVILCRDTFAPGRTCECRFDEENLQTGGRCGACNFSVSGEKALSELGLGQDTRPIFSVADGEIVERRTEGGKTVLLGEMHCHALCVQGEEYTIADFSVPFRTVLDGSWDAIGTSVTVPSCRMTVMRDALRADGEVVLMASAVAHTPMRILKQATFAEAEPQSRADLEICYPCTGETLWDVSRRYGVSPEAVANANGLSADAPGDADSLADAKYLMIP